MPLKKKPVTGMRDILPAEMQVRDFVMSQIKETYRSFGFTQIETPCVEHIENLTSKQGGDNEKLIFKILKRGEKLNLETAESETDLTDSGLRYDLTLPLSRYYSNNAAQPSFTSRYVVSKSPVYHGSATSRSSNGRILSGSWGSSRDRYRALLSSM